MRTRSEAGADRRDKDHHPSGVPSPNGPPRPRCFSAVWQGDRVVLLRRDDDGEVRKDVVRAEYSAFVHRAQFEGLEPDSVRQISNTSRVRGYSVEGDWIRFRFASHEDRKECCAPKPEFNGLSRFKRLGLDTYEADLNPVKRWLADNDVEIQKPRRAYLDIEADSRVPFSEKSRARILCWSIVNEQGAKTLGMLEEDTDDAERELLEDLFYELLQYEQVVAWYGGDFREDSEFGFDFPLIAARARILGLRIEPRRWLWVDQLEIFRKFNASSGESGDEKASLGLDAVAKKLLGDDLGKLPGVDGSMSWQLWEAGGEDRKLLGRYNVWDSNLLRLVEEKTGFLALLDAICQACGTFPDNYGAKGVNFVESFLLRLGRQRGYHFPSNWRNRGSTPFEGAYVMEPTPGIHHNVHVVDFAGLYPSIIQTFNMSLETHAPNLAWRPSLLQPTYLAHSIDTKAPPPLPPGHCRVPITGEVFRTDPRGILVDAIYAVREERKRYDKLKASLPPKTPEWVNAERAAQGCKIFVNTFYGVVGSTFSRLFLRELGESVTQAGVYLLRDVVVKEAVSRGMRCVAGDTDSAFITDTTEDCIRQFVRDLNEVIIPERLRGFGCKQIEIKLDYEKEFSILLIVGKKRYAGRFKHFKGKAASADSKPEVKGLEYKRGDTAKLCREFQFRVIDRLLSGQETVQSMVELVKQERTHVLDGDLTFDDFVLSKRLSGAVDSYASKKKKNGEDAAQPIHIQVAKRLRELGKDVNEGTRIEYIVTDATDNLVAVPMCEYEEGSEDRFYLWENLVYPASQRVLEAVFPEHNWRLYEKARPPKPRRGKPVPEEQMGFGFENPGSQLFKGGSVPMETGSQTKGIKADHEIEKQRREHEEAGHEVARGRDRGRTGNEERATGSPDRTGATAQEAATHAQRSSSAPKEADGRETRTVRTRSQAGGRSSSN